jgi:YbbR domain-containing protein
MQKELPIQISWVGTLSDDLVLAEATLYPGKVQVVGGSRILKNVSTIYTEPIHLEKIKKSGKLSVNLLLDPPSLKKVPGSKDVVTVTFEVKKRK